ncbi:hypothetical protein COBT_003602, partial [Conglomerata obtusa]
NSFALNKLSEVYSNLFEENTLKHQITILYKHKIIYEGTDNYEAINKCLKLHSIDFFDEILTRILFLVKL